ncbi:MAG: acyl-CoA thioesterase [Alphaproteobacteria bacterium]|nr:acyl-CoA thioesterase [Alphaproteobacteria bacterium]
MAYAHAFTVTFSEVDAAGIVFFSRTFEYCHAAYEAALAAGGLPLARILSEQDWVLPLVRAEADFKRPMRLGEALTVQVRLGELGDSSATLDFRIVDAEGRLRASARCVHVCLDQASFRPRRIAGAWVDAMRAAGA